MIIVPLFDLKHNIETGIYTIITLVAIRCPLCGGIVRFRDRKSRKVKRSGGEVWHFRLRRMLCEECETLHTEIPEIIQPYKHYDSETIQGVIDGTDDSLVCTADDSTIHRWKTEFSKATTEIAQRLASVNPNETVENESQVSFPQTLESVRDTEPYWLAYVMHLLISNGHQLCTQFAFRPLETTGRIHNTGNNRHGRSFDSGKTHTETG